MSKKLVFVRYFDLKSHYDSIDCDIEAYVFTIGNRRLA